MKSITLLFAFFVISSISFAQCTNLIDLNDWHHTGANASNGNWFVAGAQVVQTENDQTPTIFASDANFINVKLQGNIQVLSTAGDDDWVGFVFGMENPATITNSSNGDVDTLKLNTYVFDWKRLGQTQTIEDSVITSQGGFSLFRVDGEHVIPGNNINPYWTHITEPGFTMIDSLYGNQYGYVQDQQYQFTLIYTSSRTTILIDSDTIFDLEGCFVPGKFGFYNHSQGGAIYSNFTYELLSDFSNTATCVNQGVDFSFYNDACADSLLQNSIVDSWYWDFGNGDTSILPNASTVYTNIGDYDVQLILEDINGCVDTVDKTITVHPPAPAPLVSDIQIMCAGDSALASTPSNAAFYQWEGEDCGDTNNCYYNTPGIYDLIIVDSNGCVASSPFEVHPDSQYYMQLIQADWSECGDYVLFVEDTNLVSMEWYNGSTDTMVSIQNDGLYWVIGYDGTCYSSDSILITNFLEPTGILSNYYLSTVCEDNEVTFLYNDQFLVDSVMSELGASWYWEFGNGDTSYAMEPSTYYSSPGSYEISLIITYDAGCTDTIVQNYTIHPNPNPPVVNDVQIVCVGQSATAATAAQAFYYDWIGTNCGDTNLCPIFIPGDYTLQITDSNLCTSSAAFSVSPSDREPVEILEKWNECGEYTLFVDNPNEIDYEWSDNSRDTFIIVTETGPYWVTADDGVCISEDTVILGVFPDFPEDTIPNVFTPNNDNLNEQFLISLNPTLEASSLRIFSRWGKEVYLEESSLPSWNGKGNSGNEMSPGTYYWILNYTELCEQRKKNMTGHVTLLK